MSAKKTGTSVAFITGANSGIGKDAARQLALTGRYSKVLIGSRDKRKGEAARTELEQRTGMRVFQVINLNLSDVAQVRATLAQLSEPIDDLVMNAGGFGGKEPFKVTRDGVAEIIASNVLGHAVLLNGLLKRGLLKRSAILAGSEAARGVPQMKLAPPVLQTGSVMEFVGVCDGSRFQTDKAGTNAAYGWAKLVGALWMGHVARSHPELKILTMSPGGTAGTGAADVYPQPGRFLVKYFVMPVLMPLLGMGHGLEVGAKRMVDAVLDPRFRSGVFYGSRKPTGEIIDQTELFPALADSTTQDNAAEALLRFAEARGSTRTTAIAESTA
jgi:NAD(P)-dependent dehydrogenase (short-subunit alcohol dehydrogenase family)